LKEGHDLVDPSYEKDTLGKRIEPRVGDRTTLKDIVGVFQILAITYIINALVSNSFINLM